MSLRVRYAPSPTGWQHIGGVRTALFNYLFACSQEGKFILRVEDTDASRCKQEYLDDMLKSLHWLSIYPDEYGDIGEHAPYIQSKRKKEYQHVAQRLVDEGHAYYCYTSSLQKDGDYDRSSRDISQDEIAFFKEKEKRGEVQTVIRLKLPLEGEQSFNDTLLGNISRKFQDMIVDPILLKSDAMPTYHLANVVDDHAMHISHVLRSQEWIPTTSIHVYMYKILGWQTPSFMHLPMVLGDDGQKLSKRNGSISIRELHARGILPEALINCIALLGWSFDDSREFFSLEELKECFTQGKLQKNPAKFSMKKLLWFNSYYMKQIPNEVLLDMLMPRLESQYNVVISKSFRKRIMRLIPDLKERMEYTTDALYLLKALFVHSDIHESITLVEDRLYIQYAEGLHTVLDILEHKEYTSSDELNAIIRSTCKKQDLKLGNILMPLRIALVGTKSSLPILEMALALDREDMLQRIHIFLKLLQEKKV